MIHQFLPVPILVAMDCAKQARLRQTAVTARTPLALLGLVSRGLVTKLELETLPSEFASLVVVGAALRRQDWKW